MNNNLDIVICVFCEGYVGDAIDYTKTQYCVPCNEYKGIMTLREYQTEYGHTLVIA
jgi:ribosomal protein S26